MPIRAGKDALIGVGLAFTAGFVDAAAFIALTGLFTAHVTGNFVLIGAELVSTSTGVLAKLLALPMFILAVAVTRLIALALERRGSPPLRPLLALEATVLIAFTIAGVAMSPLGSPDGAKAIGVGMLGVAAMGIQNGIGRLVIGHLATTTVMTVNVTQAVIDRLCGAKLDDQVSTRLRRTLSAVAAFAAGALAGAFGIAALSFWCVLVPAFVLIGLLMVPDRKSGS
ncbi:YoaK family protein [Methylobacterium sp. Leaf100]|uniref:YoaK family protein n=1 Tax=Methylobacterium sp. Leaf100 TaxID=1736252 RepID=UPI0006F547CD|nr:YoaK family protein [Methylobacterium sp. Leaf100]KQP26553.1 permease [Methylobacterium sp. Leaf100]